MSHSIGRNTTIDLFDFARDFHQKMAAYYEQMQKEATHEEPRLLLQYLTEHEAHLAQNIREYEQEVPDKVRERWFRFTDEDLTSEALADAKFRPDMTADEVLGMALKVDGSLIKLFKQMRENLQSEEVQDAIDSLVQMEEQAQIKLMNSSRYYDE